MFKMYPPEDQKDDNHTDHAKNEIEDRKTEDFVTSKLLYSHLLYNRKFFTKSLLHWRCKKKDHNFLCSRISLSRDYSCTAFVVTE
jgi:hypothetical protein